MSYLKKSTYPLFETISVIDGSIQNESFHRKRFVDSYKTFFNALPQYDVLEDVKIPGDFQKGQVKLRISYGYDSKSIVFEPYQKRTIKTLKLVDGGSIDYSLKFKDRLIINELVNKKRECDDILIVKNGYLTDTSYANIIFYTGKEWVTPNTPLLQGTMRDKLLSEKKISETKIIPTHLKDFKAFQLINAMIGFDPTLRLPINNIR